MKHATGEIERVHVIRIEPNEDVLDSIQSYCDEHSVHYGVILSGIGSLDGCTFFDPVELEGKPGCYGYVTPINLSSPIELVGINGIICSDPDGTIVPHIHASFADVDGNEYGGHLKQGNKVLVTVELVIAEIGGVKMIRKEDPIKSVPVLFPESEK